MIRLTQANGSAHSRVLVSQPPRHGAQWFLFLLTCPPSLTALIS